MFSRALVLNLIFLSYGSQDVLAFSSIIFSPISQCGPFNVSFSDGHASSSMPLSLTVIPINSSSPLSLPIPANSWNSATSTGAAVTFLPLLAGTAFVASLDDGSGQGTGGVSSVIQVLPSNDTSCLPTTSSAGVDDPFTVVGLLAQCQPFDLLFNSSSSSNLPTVRAFVPSGPSFFLNTTSSNETQLGKSSYMMAEQQGNQVVMLIEDGQGTKQTTSLITVGGSRSSSTKCLPEKFGNGQHKAAQAHGLSKGAVIGIVVACIAIVAIVAILMIIYVRRERRRSNGLNLNFTGLESQDSSIDEKEGSLSVPQANLTSLTPLSSPPPPPENRYISPPPSIHRKPVPSSPRHHRKTIFGNSTTTSLPSPEFIGYRDRGDELTPQGVETSPAYAGVSDSNGAKGGKEKPGKSPGEFDNLLSPQFAHTYVPMPEPYVSTYPGEPLEPIPKRRRRSLPPPPPPLQLAPAVPVAAAEPTTVTPSQSPLDDATDTHEMDIEHILDMATLYTNTSSPDRTTWTPSGLSSAKSPSFHRRSRSSHSRAPANVPMGAEDDFHLSMMFPNLPKSSDRSLPSSQSRHMSADSLILGPGGRESMPVTAGLRPKLSVIVDMSDAGSTRDISPFQSDVVDSELSAQVATAQRLTGVVARMEVGRRLKSPFGPRERIEGLVGPRF